MTEQQAEQLVKTLASVETALYCIAFLLMLIVIVLTLSAH